MKHPKKWTLTRLAHKRERMYLSVELAMGRVVPGHGSTAIWSTRAASPRSGWRASPRTRARRTSSAGIITRTPSACSVDAEGRTLNRRASRSRPGRSRRGPCCARPRSASLCRSASARCTSTRTSALACAGCCIATPTPLRCGRRACRPPRRARAGFGMVDGIRCCAGARATGRTGSSPSPAPPAQRQYYRNSYKGTAARPASPALSTPWDSRPSVAVDRPRLDRGRI